jgi:predicted negative regulator of RcsB-dependent stress response
MAYDLEEQESLAEIKAWWDKWGTLILSVVTAVCLASAAFQGWRWYKAKESADAGALYAQMIQAENGKDFERVQRIAQRLQGDFSSTVYSGLGALLAARSAEADNKPQEAEKSLKWVVESKDFPGIQAVAAVRLAGLQMDQKQYDAALATLAKVKDAAGQEGIVNDRKGDIELAMGKTAEARKSWEAALRSLDASNPLSRLIEIKLAALPKA